MNVLGISPLDKDATVSLMENGRIVFAAGEERFSRVKLLDGFPMQALQVGLAYTGMRLEEIDVVAYPFFDWQYETALFTKNIQHEQGLLEEAPYGDMGQQIKTALAKVPVRT